MESSGGRTARQRAALTPDDDTVTRFLDAWIRSGRAFRGRQVWELHRAPDGSRVDRLRYLALRELVHGGPRRLTEIADILSMTRSHASRMVDSLVRRGLGERTVPDGDRRVTLISATPTARALLAEIDADSRQLIADRLAGFSPAEAATFSTYFSRFADEVERWSQSVPAATSEPFDDR